jgi:hypothetical protein
MGYNSKKGMWEKLIQEMRDSKKHQKNWCEEKGINFSTLKYWMQKLSSKAKPLEEQWDNKETKWLKVAVNPEAVLIPQSTKKIEVCIGNYRVVVPENFSKESMTSIIEVLSKIC